MRAPRPGDSDARSPGATGCGSVKAIAGIVCDRVLSVWDPPVKQVDDRRNRQQDGSNPHHGQPSAKKCHSEPCEQNTDDNVRIKLIVLRRPVKLPVPAPQRSPAEQDVIHAQSAHCHSCDLRQTGDRHHSSLDTSLHAPPIFRASKPMSEIPERIASSSLPFADVA